MLTASITFGANNKTKIHFRVTISQMIRHFRFFTLKGQISPNNIYLKTIDVVNSKIREDILIFREMKKDYCTEKEDEGGGGLLANPDLALQVFNFDKFTLN